MRPPASTSRPVSGGVPDGDLPHAVPAPVCLLLHGSEEWFLGGPSVRVPRTAEELGKIGVQARASVFSRVSAIPEELVHLFNVWPPESALQALRQLKAAGKRVVFSPIYLDLSERPVWSMDGAQDETGLQAYLKGRGRLHEIVPGHHAMVREMLALADHVIFLSEAERKALATIGAVVPADRSSLVYNPVDAAHWQNGDPALFRETYLNGLPTADYVLCLGRIEPRKNQLGLARAMRDLPLHLVLVGHEGDPDYAARIRQQSGSQVLMVGRLPHETRMLQSALKGARAFALPSWAEGASLAVLEAAAAGVPLILSDRSSEREYFGDLARYCHPGDLDGLRRALCEILADETAPARAAEVQRHVTRTFDWDSYARATARAYARAWQAPLQAVAAPAGQTQPSAGAAFDLTVLTRPGGVPRQGLRCTEALAQALLSLEPAPRLVFWSPERRCFLDLPGDFLAPGAARLYASRAAGDDSLQPVVLVPGTTLILCGGLRSGSMTYLHDLEDLKARTGGALVALVEDAGPCLRPDLFSAREAADCTARLHRLSECADHLVVPSQETATDLGLALETAPRPLDPERVSVLPLPALPVPEGQADEALRTRFEGRAFALVAGPVARRGNLSLLTRTWARFAAEGICPDLHLVIAGGIEEGGEELADSIARDPRIARRVHLLDVDGPDLAWLYRKARFTLCPSHSEGWGWPVVESLAHGAPCLVADIPVLTGAALAIGGPAAEALDPDDLPAWKARIAALAGAPPARQDPPPPAGAWDGVAAELAALARQPRPVSLARRLLAGEVASAGLGAAPQALRFGTGWHPAGQEVRWMAADRAEAWLRADGVLRSGQDHVLLHLRLRAPRGMPRTRLGISCGTRSLFDAPVDAISLPEDLVFLVPAAALDGTGCVPLALDLPPRPMPRPPEQAGCREEPRTGAPDPCGIGLVSATLLDADLGNPLAVLQRPERWSEGGRALEVDFALDSHRDTVAPGLHFSPAWGVGSLSSRFALFVPVLPGGGACCLKLTLRPVARKDRASGARISWNGRLLAEAAWHDTDPVDLTLPLTETDLLTGPAVLGIAPTSLATPADLGLGHEAGLSGLGLFDLGLIPMTSG